MYQFAVFGAEGDGTDLDGHADYRPAYTGHIREPYVEPDMEAYLDALRAPENAADLNFKSGAGAEEELGDAESDDDPELEQLLAWAQSQIAQAHLDGVAEEPDLRGDAGELRQIGSRKSVLMQFAWIDHHTDPDHKRHKRPYRVRRMGPALPLLTPAPTP